MRLGAPVEYTGDPEAYVRAARARGFTAVYTPWEEADPPAEAVRDLVAAAAAHEVVIAETGAWSNPLHPDPEHARRRTAYCIGRLALAEELGARCCVNVAGCVAADEAVAGTIADWWGPHPADLSEATFERLVAKLREIIDAVRPQRTTWAIEAMPWMHPDSLDGYERLLRAVDRPAFAVHFDPVNLLTSPRLAWGTTAFLEEAFRRLGPRIVSCHAKDIVLRADLTVHLDEVAPGTGLLDYPTFLRLLAAQGRDLPLMLEHLPDEDAYDRAAAHIRRCAATEGIEL